MDIKVYDNVGKMSVYLKLKLEELDKLQKEKEDILRTIE